jgi:SpoVK/Ycf46/Vps4 family AAA+-type ATPase
MNENLKNLILSYYNDDPEGFYTFALKIAAQEAKDGREKDAKELRAVIEKAVQEKRKKKIYLRSNDDLVQLIESSNSFDDIVIPIRVKKRLQKIIIEYKKREQLKNYGLDNRKKILISGPPGTGKTMTASVISNEIKLPFYVISMDKIITKYMGETSVKLRMVFEMIEENPGVYLFDEFDAIGAERSSGNDVGEMRRVVNSFLQLLEQSNSNSLIIAATNNQKILDTALFRRFDDIIVYELPKSDEIEELVNLKIGYFLDGISDLREIVELCLGLSHSEIANACKDSMKDMVINERRKIDLEIFKTAVTYRRSPYENRL